MIGERPPGSEFMAWAKTRAAARYNLATSGVAPLPLAELGATLADLELTGTDGYGHPPLVRALSERCGVGEDRLVTAMGTTFANYLALLALVGPGDEVLLESPAYEPLAAAARAVGAEIRSFIRRAEDGFRVDPAEVARRVSARTRLIVLTNLHNPSGAWTDEATLAQLGAIARRVGARILVDEVYLELRWVEGERSPRSHRSAVHLGPEFVATGSLTKAYGLSGLRCGWVLAEPELVRRMWGLYDVVVGTPAHAAERLSVVALAQLERLADRAATLLRRNCALLDRFLAGRADLEVARPECGTVLFPRWRGGDVDPLCRLLREKHDTTVVPGRFFGAPEHFRLGIGGDTDSLAAGLDRLSAALDEVGQ